MIKRAARVWTDVPQELVLEDLAGTFYGETRAEVVAFMLKNWLQEHYDVSRRAEDDHG